MNIEGIAMIEQLWAILWAIMGNFFTQLSET